jgi:hypothetical protein
MITLPRYIVERNGHTWSIWDTVEHEYTGFEFDTKQAASDKCSNFNQRSQ